MSKNIVFEGWLTKSPPTKRIWRTKWRRRWFALRQSGELPGQYFLDYYTDRNYRRLKGTINLDLCEQVDAGLHMERTGSGNLDPKLRGSVFTIQTQSRTYHLEADSEADMEKWVDAICRVCGLRATDEADETGIPSPSSFKKERRKIEKDTKGDERKDKEKFKLDIKSQAVPTEGPFQGNLSSASTPAEHNEMTDYTGPYIPISECITGVRAQDSQRAFTFDPKNIVTSTRHPLERVPDHREHQMYMSQPQIRVNNPDSENDSTMSDEDCKSLNTSQSNIRDYSVAKSFTKLAISPAKNNVEKRKMDKNHYDTFLEERNAPDRHPLMVRDGLSEEGPPVPPRPPKTFAISREMFQGESWYHGPRLLEQADLPDVFYGIRGPRRISQGAPSSPPRQHHSTRIVRMEDDEELFPNTPSLQYCNLSVLPPAVDRALKPRPNSHSISGYGQGAGIASYDSRREYSKPETLQYLDLDLMPKTSPTKIQNGKKVSINHGKSLSDADAECTYKTVDFLKTEAFNITRQDAEASRSNY